MILSLDLAMTEKVTKSKYRLLNEFAIHTLCSGFISPKRGSQQFFFGLQKDFRLMISNMKTFNPSGTIYHTEAERIEVWASDHISKAASCVIEYETDWNIDVDRDEDVNVDANEDAAGAAAGGTGRTGSIRPTTPMRCSPSVLSASVPPIKDGVGVFPPGSGWAEVMLALKLKGAVAYSSSDRVFPLPDF